MTCVALVKYLSLELLDPALGLGKAVFASDVKDNDSCSCSPAAQNNTDEYCK